MSIEKETNAIRRMVRSPWRVNYRKTASETESVEGKEVHHVSGDHTDNAPSNLMALAPEAHRRLHTQKRKRFRPKPAAKARTGKAEVTRVKRIRWR